MVQGVTMGYSEPKKVICRRTGEVVGSNYVPAKLNGQKRCAVLQFADKADRAHEQRKV